MKLVNKTASLLALAWVAFIATPARAATIATATGGSFSNSNVGFVGQSFTVTGSGSFTNISFNFFSDTGSTTPAAFGTAFLLNTLYTGTPAALSSGSTGYLGQATAASGFYSFGSGVSLLAGTQYFLYSNAAFSAGAITGNNAYAGGSVYIASTSSSVFFPNTSANFRVTGDAVGAPDGGSTALLLALGVAGLWFGRRARQA
ncbi:MAG: VPDSG-CTERM sorting domain-containing protein [Opitutaceae bacterium]|nr:VPDSG-CTERM sorting domain-containing protein [Opitutaceae bacterium]